MPVPLYMLELQYALIFPWKRNNNIFQNMLESLWRPVWSGLLLPTHETDHVFPEYEHCSICVVSYLHNVSLIFNYAIGVHYHHFMMYQSTLYFYKLFFTSFAIWLTTGFKVTLGPFLCSLLFFWDVAVSPQSDTTLSCSYPYINQILTCNDK